MTSSYCRSRNFCWLKTIVLKRYTSKVLPLPLFDNRKVKGGKLSLLSFVWFSHIFELTSVIGTPSNILGMSHRQELNSSHLVLRSYISEKFKLRKASGPSNIPTKLVKDAAEYLSQPLFNSSLTTGVSPDIWKIAKVPSNFKTGTRDDLNNYGPISVLFTISKIFEKIVHDQLVKYLWKRKCWYKINMPIESYIQQLHHW